MTNTVNVQVEQEVINVLNTPANRAAYAVEQDRGVMVQGLIEGLNIGVAIDHPLVEAVEIALDAIAEANGEAAA